VSIPASLRHCFFLLFATWCAFGQSNSGELRLHIIDPEGLAVRSSVDLASDANQYHQSFDTDYAGALTVRRLPFGIYRLEVRHTGFTPAVRRIEIRSAEPREEQVQLGIEAISTSVNVVEGGTLIDPDRTGNMNQIGSEDVEHRLTSLPGRSLQDLVNSEPGWLYEGNAVLHPRGSEYQVQFVVDGVPLTDNRSPGHGAEIEADNVESMTVYTGGIPAEYGRKMGGVVEVNTARSSREGWHGQIDLSGGSFDTAAGYALLQFQQGKNAFEASAAGAMTSRYLNPPVTQNYTNHGTTGDFFGNYDRVFNPHDRLSLNFRHALARFDIPNEQVQQQAGQRQDGAIFEDMGIVSYQHIFSAQSLADVRAMFRSDSNSLSSNLLSTPIIAFQRNSFNQVYFRGSTSLHRGNHELKIGIESDAVFLNERFGYIITDPSQFDPGTPTTFRFRDSRPDLEQSAFVQDLVRLGAWTLSAGLRWDHYQLIVNQNAVSPRLAIARYFSKADMVVHASYDRVFQTPDFENILLSSSPEVVVLNPNVLRLPVEPSRGNYYEAGITKGFFGKVAFEANGYWRSANNFADDDLLLNTPVAFPIAFRKASIYGAEGKLNLPQWKRFSGFVSYSYMVGSAYFPVTGGLFLGDSATNALTQLGGRFWVSQDQRNTVRARLRCQISSRFWGAVGAEYGSGLPVDFDGTYEQALAQYGQQVIDRVNFERDRVRPMLAVSASAGADLWKKDTFAMRLQVDAFNLNDRLNLINFAGLFSGNAIAPPRGVAVRLHTDF
jgi:outer membrane cobalamin receptor